jgi:hypothetical protein
MGDSSKRGVENKIGTFDSGLKYAIALLLRNNVSISIVVLEDGQVEESFSFSTNVQSCQGTGKEKELICVGTLDGDVHQTGFAKNLGFNWDLWMAYRELYSNMLDEGGSLEQGFPTGTAIQLSYEDGSKFDQVVKDKDKWVLSGDALYKDKSFEVYSNPEGYLRIYKQTILVYENKDWPSLYKYNLSFGELDERRVLRDVHSVKQTLQYKVAASDSEELLSLFVSPNFKEIDKEFLSGSYYGYSFGNTLIKYVQDVYLKFGEVNSYGWIMEAVKKSSGCVLPGRVLKSIDDHLWTYSNDVVVEREEQTEGTVKSLSEAIQIAYDIKIEDDVEVVYANLRGGTVIADKFNRKVLVDEQFDLHKDFPKFLVQYLDLTTEGNIIDTLSTMLANRLKK